MNTRYLEAEYSGSEEPTPQPHKKPFFSVVIPAYNRARLLRRALLSLERQTFDDFEVIVVDDHSSEDICSVVSKSESLDIRLLKNKGKGGNAARNFGSDAANGRFICYLDSDDIFLPQRLANGYNVLRKTDADILLSPSFVWRGEDYLYSKPLRPPLPHEDISEYYFLADQRFITSTFVIKRELATSVRWDEQLLKVQDPDFMIRLVRSNKEITFVDDPQTVLFDDDQRGRLTSSAKEHNMSEWLTRRDGLLTDKAARAFRMSALAYEVSLRNRTEGLALVLKEAVRPSMPKKLALKTIYRIFAGERIVKRSAQVSVRNKDAHRPDVANYVRSMDRESYLMMPDQHVTDNLMPEVPEGTVGLTDADHFEGK